MAAVDKIYVTHKEFKEIRKFLKETKKAQKEDLGELIPTNQYGWTKKRQPMSEPFPMFNLSGEMDLWLALYYGELRERILKMYNCKSTYQMARKVLGKKTIWS